MYVYLVLNIYNLLLYCIIRVMNYCELYVSSTRQIRQFIWLKYLQYIQNVPKLLIFSNELYVDVLISHFYIQYYRFC